MTSANPRFNNAQSPRKSQLSPMANSSLPEIIEALTPLFIAFIGALIGVVILVQPMGRIDDTRATAGLGLAGTAIAGAAGLARTGRSEQDSSVKYRDVNFELETPEDH